jgi:hypothetical protein
MIKRAQKTAKYITNKYAGMLQSSLSDLNLNEELKKFPYILWDVLDNQPDIAVFYRKEFAGHSNVVCSFDFYDENVEWQVNFDTTPYDI